MQMLFTVDTRKVEYMFSGYQRTIPKASVEGVRDVAKFASLTYAFQARAEWEILGLAEELGKRLKEEYDLHPSGQSGIGLN